MGAAPPRPRERRDELGERGHPGHLIGGLYALFACGLSLMFGVMKVINLAHGDLAVVAGYIAVGVITVTHIPAVWSFVVVVPAMALIGYVLQRTLIRAVADDREAAQLAGADYRHVFGIAAAIAFATVALGGVAYGMFSTFNPTIGTDQLLLFAFAAVVIGGLGSLWGTLLGGIILGVAQQVGAQINANDQILAGYLVFLLVLVIRPQGLTGARSAS
jgi:branched-chain amino acid transport system permease protein